MAKVFGKLRLINHFEFMIRIFSLFHLLIVENDIRLPHHVEWKSYHRDVSEVRGVPREVGVLPRGRDPAVGRQDLVLLVHVNDLVQTDVVLDHERLGGVGHGADGFLVVGKQIFGQAVFVLTGQGAREGHRQKN